MRGTARNVIFSLIGFVWPSFLLIAATPVVVNGLGEAAYGVWALVANLIGYMSFFNSLQTAGTKYLAQYRAVQDEQNIQKLLGTSLFFNLGVGVLGAMAIVVSAPYLAHQVFSIPVDLQIQSAVAFRLAGIGFFLTTIGWWGASIQSGLQRYDWLTIVAILMATFSTLGSIVAIWLGRGVIGVVSANVASSLLAAAIYIWSLPRLLPGLKWKLSFDWLMFKLIFSFGLFSTIHMVFGVISFQLDRTLLGIWLGTAAVTTYSVPLSVSTRIHQLCAKSLEVVFPLTSTLDSEKRKDQLRRLFLRAQNLNVVLVVMLSVPLLILAQEIMSFWINPEFSLEATFVFRLLVISYAILGTNVVVSALAAGLGHPEIIAVFAFFLSLITTAANFLFIPRWGVNGAGVASLTATALTVPILILYINHRFLNFPLMEIIRFTLVRPIFAGLLIAVGLVLARGFVTSLLILIITILLSCSAYVLSTFIFGVWEKHELKLFQESWHYVFERIRP